MGRREKIAAYGVMMYVSMIFASTFVGYCVGMAPVVSYHFGAENTQELHGLLKKSLVILTTLGITMTIAAEVLATPLSAFFVGYDQELLALTVRGFRVFSLSFLFMGFGIFTSSFFTALNDGLTSAIVSFLRTLVFQCTAILLFPVIWGIDGVWIAVVAAEVMSMIVGGIFLIAKRGVYHY